MDESHVMTTNKYVPMGPWGSQGTILKEAPTSAMAIKQAGLDWNVEVRPCLTEINGQTFEFPDKKVVVRTSDNQPLSVVGNRWKPIQNTSAFSFFDPFIEDGLCEYETAGFVNDGEKIFIVAKIKADPMEVIKGDIVNSYIVMTNTHSNAQSSWAVFTNIRFICSNVLPAIMREEDKSSARHQGDTLKNIQQLRNIIDIRQRTFSSTLEQYQLLASKSMTGNMVDEYLDRVLAVKPSKLILSADSKPSNKVTKSRIKELIDTGKGVEIPGVRGTYWGVMNSVIEYLNHHKGRELNNRLNSTLYGDSRVKSKKALEVALDMVS